MVNQIKDFLFVIKVRLPNSPLRDLNSYVLKTPQRNLLIDTGFNLPECLADLEQGIVELELDMNKTDILLTHFHADHIGLIDKIVKPGSRVYIGEIDKQLLDESSRSNRIWVNQTESYQREGFPAGILDKASRINPARVLIAEKPVETIPLRDGELLTVGDITLRCIHTPGHTPGHICLYNDRDKFMVLGDHVLFDISPNITTWPSLSNSLGHYLESLKLIRQFDVELPLPAHRECTITMTERIDQLLLHHEKRFNEMRTIIRDNPGLNGYEIAGRMKWKIRAQSWDDFPLAQKWFAMGESLSHLDYLVEAGDVSKKTAGVTPTYFLSADSS